MAGKIWTLLRYTGYTLYGYTYILFVLYGEIKNSIGETLNFELRARRTFIHSENETLITAGKSLQNFAFRL